MDNLLAVQLLLSGAGSALMILLAVRFAQQRPCRVIEQLGFVYCILAALHMLSKHTVPIAEQGVLGQGMSFLSSFDAAVFWMLTQCLFDERFRLRAVHFISVLAVALTWALPYGALLRDALVVGLMAHVAVIGLMGYRHDLVGARRRFRLALAVLVPIMVVTTTVTSLIYPPGSPLVELIDAAKFAGLSLLFTIWMTRLDGVLLAAGEVEGARLRPQAPAADRIELDRLRAVVAQGVCFEPGLTIGIFAQKVDLPEHRVRKLINQELGYRNFAAFLNDHRIDEAKRRLADPNQARAQIITHAFALGYNSLAPFNRAFRERVGKSPTEYRAEQLEEMIA